MCCLLTHSICNLPRLVKSHEGCASFITMGAPEPRTGQVIYASIRELLAGLVVKPTPRACVAFTFAELVRRLSRYLLHLHEGYASSLYTAGARAARRARHPLRRELELRVGSMRCYRRECDAITSGVYDNVGDGAHLACVMSRQQ